MTLLYRDAVYVEPLGISGAVEAPVADDGVGIEAPVGSLGVPAGGLRICDGSKGEECEQQFFIIAVVDGVSNGDMRYVP